MTVETTKHFVEAPESRESRRGFTLTEVAIVLGIIGLILGAIWAAATSVYANQRAAAFTQNMTLYIAAVRGACGGNCTAVPTVTEAIPTVANSQSGTGPTASVVTSGTYNGGVDVNYTGILNTATAGITLCNGLIAAATATSSSVSGSGGSLPTPTINCAVGKAPTCTATGFVCTVSGGGTCTTANTLPAGDSYSLAITSAQCSSATTLDFVFAPSF